jgi:FKBP-type peptidyl-prolyl cis-trans isomerase
MFGMRSPGVGRAIGACGLWFVGVLSTTGLAEDAAPALIPAPPAPSRPAELAALDTPAGELGYALGLRIGSRIAADFKQEGPSVDPGALARGLADAILGATPLISEEKVARSLDAFDRKMRERERSFREELAVKARANKAKATEFLASNVKKRGVRTTPSGLQYEIMSKGQGVQPRSEQTVRARFVGRHLDGREFDRTAESEPPASFPIAEVIPGWQEALALMTPGSKWRLFVPSQLAYGEEGRLPEIEPNELLVFELELVAVDIVPVP